MVAGESSDGGPLYVGRAHHEGGLYPGKVNPDHNCCYIAYGGAELSREEYDVNIQLRNRNTQSVRSLSLLRSSWPLGTVTWPGWTPPTVRRELECLVLI